MVVLSRKSEELDALNALAADRREIVLPIETSEPLRKGTTRKQRRRMRVLREDTRTAIVQQLRSEGRSLFRGRIAAHVRLTMPDAFGAVEVGRVIKDYLDLLSGTVVSDDAVVDHLLVWTETLPTVTSARATLRCTPLSIFAADYDRAFRLIGERAAPVPSRARFLNGAPIPPTHPWGYARFDDHDREELAYQEAILAELDRLDEEEAEQLAEDPDGMVFLDSSEPEFEDPDVRDSVRAQFEATTTAARGNWLTDQGFDARDRPGPPPRWLDEAIELGAADVIGLEDAGPGCFVLRPPPVGPTPPGRADWTDRIAREFALRLLGGWSKSRFQGPVGVDIALRGQAGKSSDVDNIARQVLAALTNAFGNGAPRFSAFRVYRLPNAEVNDVRVRLMAAARLDALGLAMSRAREAKHSDRTQHARAAID